LGGGGKRKDKGKRSCIFHKKNEGEFDGAECRTTSSPTEGQKALESKANERKAPSQLVEKGRKREKASGPEVEAKGSAFDGRGSETTPPKKRDARKHFARSA